MLSRWSIATPTGSLDPWKSGPFDLKPQVLLVGTDVEGVRCWVDSRPEHRGGSRALDLAVIPAYEPAAHGTLGFPRHGWPAWTERQRRAKPHLEELASASIPLNRCPEKSEYPNQIRRNVGNFDALAPTGAAKFPSLQWNRTTSPERTTPSFEVTTLAFVCRLSVSDALRFRYRWVLATAKRVSSGIWTYAMDGGQISITFNQAWSFIYPDAASLTLEVEGGEAGPVEVTSLGTCQKPLGHTMAIDAV